jgi:peptidoglycan/xylan/chitin deacetylase (PgdA/CDA1 family)
MAAAGMVIGSHGDRHVVLSTLPPEQQRIELTTSFRELRTLVGAPIETFCYPFGGHHSFDRQTISILEDLGVRYAFNVEPRDIEADDLVHRPLVLPRYDCNAFPHGRAHRGRAAPV